MQDKILMIGIAIGFSGLIGTYLLFSIKIFKSEKFNISFLEIKSSMNRSRRARNIVRFMKKKTEALERLAKQERVSIIAIIMLMIG